MDSFWKILGIMLWQSIKSLGMLGPAVFFGTMFPPLLIFVAILFVVMIAAKLSSR